MRLSYDILANKFASTSLISINHPLDLRLARFNTYLYKNMEYKNMEGLGFENWVINNMEGLGSFSRNMATSQLRRDQFFIF